MSIQIENDMCVVAGEGVGGHRFEGYDLATKYGWMQSGQGADAVHAGVDALHELSARYARSQQTLRQKMDQLGVSWQGTSADTAAGAMTRLAGWVSGASESATQGGGSVAGYGSSFADMKPKIPDPADAGPRPTGDSALDAAMGVAGPATGLESAYAKRMQALDQRANAALYAHQAATQAALVSFPAGAPPPSVALGGGAPAGTHSAAWTPLTPLTSLTGVGGAEGGAGAGSPGGAPAPGPGGGFLPPPPTGFRPRPESPSVPVPRGGAGGPGHDAGGGPGPVRPLATRGGPGGPEPGVARVGGPDSPGGPGGARGPGAGGVPTAGTGAGGLGRDERPRDERPQGNRVSIPSDGPFVVPLDEDVTSPVIGARPATDDAGWW